MTKHSKHKKILLLSVLAITIGIGIALRINVQAANSTVAVSAEIESGTLTSPAQTVSDTTASGGKAVSFSQGTTAGSLLFEDDFTGSAGSSFDVRKWHEYSTCGYNSSAAYGLITCGEKETLDGQGHLIIPATPTAGQSLMTGDNFRFLYGTVSAWIKMPSQVGYWPSFWTLNSNASTVASNPVGEIDINESYTTWLDSYHAGIHNWDNNSALTVSGGPDYIAANADISAGYHKYSAKVEPNKITFYYDDIQQGQPVVPVAGKTWSFGPNVTRGNWLILGLAIGGAGGQQKAPTQNAQMLVDRVEVRAN